VTIPSGVTILASSPVLDGVTGVTAGSISGKINFGQGTAYKLYFGSAPLSLNAPTDGTRLSDGTVQFLTGLTTLNQFVCTFRSNATSGDQHGYPHFIHWTRGYTNVNGGVTVFMHSSYLSGAYTGCTPGGMKVMGGCSLDWMAIGV